MGDQHAPDCSGKCIKAEERLVGKTHEGEGGLADAPARSTRRCMKMLAERYIFRLAKKVQQSLLGKGLKKLAA